MEAEESRRDRSRASVPAAFGRGMARDGAQSIVIVFAEMEDMSGRPPAPRGDDNAASSSLLMEWSMARWRKAGWCLGPRGRCRLLQKKRRENFCGADAFASSCQSLASPSITPALLGSSGLARGRQTGSGVPQSQLAVAGIRERPASRPVTHPTSTCFNGSFPISPGPTWGSRVAFRMCPPFGRPLAPRKLHSAGLRRAFGSFEESVPSSRADVACASRAHLLPRRASEKFRRFSSEPVLTRLPLVEYPVGGLALVKKVRRCADHNPTKRHCAYPHVRPRARTELTTSSTAS